MKDTKTLIIRNIAEPIRRELKVRAAQQGKTLQDLILEILTAYLKKN